MLRTAGAPHAVRLTADRDCLAADGRSPAFVTADKRLTPTSAHPGRPEGAVRIGRLDC